MFGHEVAAEPRALVREAVERWHPDVVVADVPVPSIEGRGVAEAVASVWPRPRMILVSSRPSHALDHLGIQCLAKPIDLHLLQTLLDNAGEREREHVA